MTASSPPFEPVGYGLVGFGRFCRNRLVPAFKQITGSRIAALYKRDLGQAQAAAAEFGIPAGYGDLNALLADPHVEAVYITSANCEHEEQAIAAAKAGKNVLVEKPMAVTAEACRRMIEACHQAGVKLMVAQTLRFSPAVLQVKQWIEAGHLGKLKAGCVAFGYNGTESPRTWLYDHKIAGGGVLMDVGVHCLDTLRFLLGEVSSYHVDVMSSLHPETLAIIGLDFQSRARGLIYCSYEWKEYGSSLIIQGERGTITVKSFTLPWKQVTLRLETADEKLDLAVDTDNPYGALLDSFSRAIRGLGSVAIPGEEGLKNQSIIDDLYQSWKLIP